MKTTERLNTDRLFEPVTIGSLTIPNRIAMAPMTRCFSPGGVPGPDVAAYYRRRAEGGIGLIITEGTWIPVESASNEENAPRFYGEDALAGWARVVSEVHEAGARIFPQLWHVGQYEKPVIEGIYDEAGGLENPFGPSGMVGGLGVAPVKKAKPATGSEVEAVIEAYAVAAENALRLGFDGVELHGAHGYLIDQFFWAETNHRTDHFGGDIVGRTRFAVEIIKRIRRRVGPDFPIMLRISQWKQQDYAARLVDNPDQLRTFLAPLAEAGVSAFHCSQRRFWEGEFGTDQSFAAWVKELSGLPTVTVGSVTLQNEVFAALSGEVSRSEGIDRLLDCLERGDFDMVAVGRALITDPKWAQKIRRGAIGELLGFDAAALTTLV